MMLGEIREGVRNEITCCRAERTAEHNQTYSFNHRENSYAEFVGVISPEGLKGAVNGGLHRRVYISMRWLALSVRHIASVPNSLWCQLFWPAGNKTVPRRLLP